MSELQLLVVLSFWLLLGLAVVLSLDDTTTKQRKQADPSQQQTIKQQQQQEPSSTTTEISTETTKNQQRRRRRLSAPNTSTKPPRTYRPTMCLAPPLPQRRPPSPAPAPGNLTAYLLTEKALHEATAGRLFETSQQIIRTTEQQHDAHEEVAIAATSRGAETTRGLVFGGGAPRRSARAAAKPSSSTPSTTTASRNNNNDSNTTTTTLMTTTLTQQLLLNLKFGVRSLARRKVGQWCHALNVQAEQSRRLLLLSLPLGVASERAIGRDTILRYERELLNIAQEPTTTEQELHKASRQIHQAIASADVPALVQRLGEQDPLQSAAIATATRLVCLQGLQKLLSGSRESLINCGVIPALVHAMKASTTAERRPAAVVQRLATSLLLRLAFCNSNSNSNTSYFDLCGKPHSGGASVATSDAVDFSVVYLMVQAKAFEAMAEAVLLDRYGGNSNKSDDDDELAVYEQTLALSQLRASFCNKDSTTTFLQSYLEDDHRTTRRDQRIVVTKRLLFFRSCMASMLQDSTITSDTLGSILYSSAARRR